MISTLILENKDLTDRVKEQELKLSKLRSLGDDYSSILDEYATKRDEIFGQYDDDDEQFFTVDSGLEPIAWFDSMRERISWCRGMRARAEQRLQDEDCNIVIM